MMQTKSRPNLHRLQAVFLIVIDQLGNVMTTLPSSSVISILGLLNSLVPTEAMFIASSSVGSFTGARGFHT